MTEKPDPLILGHNQFFGINHRDAEKGAELESRFSDVRNVLTVIRAARETGATSMMLNTHERAHVIAEAIRLDENLKSFPVHILLPYMAKYVRAANQKGIVSMISEMVSRSGVGKMIQLGLGAGAGLLMRDQLALLRTLIEIELMPFKGLDIRSVFLHNSLTDLAVALRLDGIVEFFGEEIRKKWGAVPAFCTLSGACAMPYLDELGLHSPWVMAPFNPIGFQMSPSREDCEKVLVKSSAQVIAMSVFAAGAVSPTDAAQYVRRHPRIRSVILGASSNKHIQESFDLFKGFVT